MASNDGTTRKLCVLGIAGMEGAIEIYGVNTLREVTIDGRFDLEEFILVLAERPPSLIAIDADAPCTKFFLELIRLGHRVVIMPVPSISSSEQLPRTARDICRLVVDFADSRND